MNTYWRETLSLRSVRKTFPNKTSPDFSHDGAHEIVSHDGVNEMGLDRRKPVFGGLRTTQAQTSLRIRAV